MKKTNNSLYVHIPFCNHICSYCDFPKVEYNSKFIKPYLTQLKKELDSYKEQSFKTIYVGGGTPTSLTMPELVELLEMLKPFSTLVEEYTFEANPESLNMEKCMLLNHYGVNRISLGIQTTNDKILKSINRKHTYINEVAAIIDAQDAGIKNINVDLILGLPGANKYTLRSDLNRILSWNITHISTYSLTVNPHTEMYIKGVKQPSDDSLREYYDIVHKRLLKNGFIHYEVSNFALPGYESKHNMTYWKDEEYIGVGLGAASYFNGKRYKNTCSITEYNKGNYNREIEEVSKQDDKTYYVMLNLRTNKGIDVKEYNARFNEDLLSNEEVNKLIKDNFLSLDNNRIIATYEGMMILDQIILKII